MNRFYDALARFALCAAVCLTACGGLAFTPSSAWADVGGGGDIGPLNCPCNRCVNVCGGALPCVGGGCNNPDAGCIAQGAVCNSCSCRSTGGPNAVCQCL